MVDGEPLDDHPSHGAAHDVRLLAPDRIEHRNGIVGHVGQGVVDAVELGRQTDVAIVESDHLEPFVAEASTPWLGVVDAL